ncbi:MAG: DUF2336 domain-containing protein [Pseudomonadota bacterium]
MSAIETSSNFAMLVDLAKETSSDKRRELLRRVTDVFMSNEPRKASECALFDEIVSAVSSDMSTQVRAELSAKVARSNSPLRRTAKRLATDDIQVAGEVLQKSRALSEDDLVEIINTATQDHMMAVSKREVVQERVSSALVDKGDDTVVVSLLENDGAKINRKTYEKVADRATRSTVLHAPFVRRQEVPVDLLNDMYLMVETSLRKDIMERFNTVSPEELNAALQKSRDRLTAAYSENPDDLLAAQTWADEVAAAGKLKPEALIGLWRDKDYTKFTVALARLSDIGFHIAQRIVDAKDIDALAMLLKAADVDRPIFNSLAMMINDGENGVSLAETYGKLYQEIPAAAAQRAIRFWKVREKTNAAA